MLKISDMRSDVMGSFHNALYLGDVRERVKILEESGEAVRGAERWAAGWAGDLKSQGGG